ncbi:hypothetical protein BT96DRAFT_969937 [Gymnopus androsaceus JB14]|uniref:Uncharacterized protein n=1 Tax=Gymnopus androsaceus JB14 TaxID=1447944 RepID=A0A6A4IM44_9AGAR|nr:hypothetical protein BT96DRAFT_969937 [Gymnopus androsaceus JB14]
MLTHRGFSAWIVVDGLAVTEEYLIAVNAQQNQVSCWIPASEGQRFSVHWSDAGGKVDTCSFITLDGITVPGRFLLGQGATYRSGVRTSKDTEAPFEFKKCQGGTNASPSSSISKESGMITLKIKRVDRVSPRPANICQDLTQAPQAQQQVSDLCTGFGVDHKAYEQSPYTWAIKAHDPTTSKDKKMIPTYVSFVFRYRSQEFLRAQGIMQPEAVPDTPPSSLPKLLSRAPVRRVASAPAGAAPPTPSPTPPLRTPKVESKPYITNPYPLHRPTVETRRTVSWRITTAPPGSSSQAALMFYEKQNVTNDTPRDDDSDSDYTPSQ